MKRLLDDGGTDFEHSLLSALRDEKPSPELVARMQQGLGLSAAATTGTAAAASSAGWLKAAVVGLAAVGIAGIGYVGLSSPESPVAVLPSVKPVPVKVEAPAAAEPKPVTVDDLAVAEAPTPAKPRPVASVAPDLREEIRLLDQARSAVRAGDGAQALALLAKYARRYPRGQFRQEAQVLRVEALEQSGNKQAAVALVALALSTAWTIAQGQGRLTDDEVRARIIAEQLALYPGNCPCPYNTDRAGRRCGNRSAWSRQGGYSPLCFPTEISDELVLEWRSNKADRE